MAFKPGRRLTVGVILCGTLFASSGHGLASDMVGTASAVPSAAVQESHKVIQQVEQAIAQGDYLRAEILCNSALTQFEKENKRSDTADIYGYLGFVYQMKGDLDQAEASYHKAVELNKALDRQTDVARVYGNLGAIEQNRGDIKKATSLYLKSSEIARQSEDTATEANALANLGMLYGAGGDLKRAEESFCKALNLFSSLEQIQAENSVREILDSMGSSCKDSKDS